MVRLTSARLAALLGRWEGAGPAYADLADRIRLLALDGRVLDGTRLPAERELALALGLSRTTVAAAYARLRDLGCAASVRGSGTYIALPAAPAVAAPDGGGLVDLTKAAMPAASIVAECLGLAARSIGGELGSLGYEPVGLPRLRVAVAEHFERRGVPTAPDQIMVTTGAQHAISLLARLALRSGGRALVEQPTYPHAMDVLASVRTRLGALPVSEAGWDLPAAEAAFAARPELAYVIPDFHNPTGASLSPEGRERLAWLAQRSGTLLVADETTALLDISRGPLLPLAAYSAQAVTIGGLSKLAWGGLRVGWIRAPRAVIARLAHLRTAMDLGTPVLEQLAAVELLAREALLVAERRSALRERHAALTEALAQSFPEWTVPKVDGGSALWVDCSPYSSSRLVLAARGHGVALTAGPRFGLGGAFEHRLRLPFTASPEDLRGAILALRAASSEGGPAEVAAPLVAV
ncbi:PLP-dependent aminotransferase family protein [Sinomonas halotolerans]|uniref:PLP-dependent aminotransferase family protein n=1 Tax=Sinomonas halotolerans TaxID=1644133 RepID=A0ABU9X0Y1_9MICC